MSEYEQLIAEHQELQKQLDEQPATVEAERVIGLIARVRSAGTDIESPSERQQLRAILRLWGAFVYEHTGQYPATQLLPFKSGTTVSTIVGALGVGAGLGMVIGLGGLFVVGLICIGAVFFMQQGQASQVKSANATRIALNAAVKTATAKAMPTETQVPIVQVTVSGTGYFVFPTLQAFLAETPPPLASPTRSELPFTAQVTYQPSPINPCGASYILGTITDIEGRPITSSDFVIRVEGDYNVDTEDALHPGEHFRGGRVEGRSPFVGLLNNPSAWDVVINQEGTAAGTWFVWLIKDRQVSARIEIKLEAECAGSAAIVRFSQNH